MSEEELAPLISGLSAFEQGYIAALAFVHRRGVSSHEAWEIAREMLINRGVEL